MTNISKPQFLVLDDTENLVFNSDRQDYFFGSRRAARQAVTEDLDEPESENLASGEVNTKRTDGVRPRHYRIYKEVAW